MKIQNRQHHFALLTILAFGAAYLFAFFSSFSKLLSGFIMQVIFILNSGLSLSLGVIANLTGGIIVLYLFFLLIKGSIQFLLRYLATKKEINHFSLSTHDSYFVFESTTPTAFTSGFINPKVYLSSSLVKLCSRSEMQAILFHEFQHQQNLDPLKDFIVRYILSITPLFPFKETVFGRYFTLSEVSCDNYACQHLPTPRPLVSALYKILSFNPSLAMNFFAANQSERLKVLVEKKPFSLKKVFSYNFSLISFFIISTFLISKSSLFIECRHLVTCLDSLFQKSNSSIMVHTDGHCLVKQEVSCKDSL